MTSKNIFKNSCIILCLSLATSINAFSAITSPNTVNVITNTKAEEPSEHAKALITRLFEIKNMDKANLSSSEKKALRKELKGMKKEMKNASGLDSRVYISVGAIIVILLLIIILR